jgi:hypothetical protein
LASIGSSDDRTPQEPLPPPALLARGRNCLIPSAVAGLLSGCHFNLALGLCRGVSKPSKTRARANLGSESWAITSSQDMAHLPTPSGPWATWAPSKRPINPRKRNSIGSNVVGLQARLGFVCLVKRSDAAPFCRGRIEGIRSARRGRPGGGVGHGGKGAGRVGADAAPRSRVRRWAWRPASAGALPDSRRSTSSARCPGNAHLAPYPRQGRKGARPLPTQGQLCFGLVRVWC